MPRGAGYVHGAILVTAFFFSITACVSKCFEVWTRKTGRQPPLGACHRVCDSGLGDSCYRFRFYGFRLEGNSPLKPAAAEFGGQRLC